MPDLSRLFRPRSIVVFGGWWAENVVTQCLKSGFDGDIWPVHPTRDEIGGVACLRDLDDLPAPPDAAFLGINRNAAIEVAARLSAMGCGGAVCFASGFAETGDDDLQRALVAAAGDMPLLGPNCYGVLNYLDGAMLWPDQHGGRPVERGVAIISQSSNIAINLSMQARGLPIAYIACVGNQAQTSLTDMARNLLADDRVTAAGLYIEGIIDPVDFAAMAEEAAAMGKSIVAIKAGKTAASQTAASTHTAALAGDAAASSAFLARSGVIEAAAPEDMLEVLKLVHMHGRLPGRRVTAMCCSGGEAGLMADLAADHDLEWPAIPQPNLDRLADSLGPLVALANPLDYHTFIWGDEQKMTDAFAAMMGDWVDLSVLVIDFPRADRCSDEAWHPAVAAMRRAGKITGTSVACLGSLAEGIPDSWAIRHDGGGDRPAERVRERASRHRAGGDSTGARRLAPACGDAGGGRPRAGRRSGGKGHPCQCGNHRTGRGPRRRASGHPRRRHRPEPALCAERAWPCPQERGRPGATRSDRG
jgi:acyl-CoA synthetase (NDP forming)